MLADFVPGLRDDKVTVLFPVGGYSTRLIAASNDGLIYVNGLSQRSQYPSQSFKERAQLVRIRKDDSADVLGFFSIGLLSNDKTTVFRISKEDDCVVSAADSDFMSF